MGGFDPRVPDWAAFFSAEAFHSFLEAVEGEIKRRTLSYTMGDGVITLAFEGRPPEQYGLQNLAQVCNQIERPEWSGAISRHFDNVFQAAKESGDLDALAADFPRARRLLKVRLYHPDYLSAVEGRLAHEALADGLLQVLVYDFPTTISTVKPEHAASWGRPMDELFAIALDNVRANDPPRRENLELPDGAVVQALVGESFFVASQALALEDHLGDPPRYGALVSVPHRHIVLYHPIRDRSVIQAIHAMIPMTQHFYQEGPGSISPSLYWRKTGAFMALPARIEGKTIEFSPPPAFVEQVLEPLGGAE